MRSFVDAVKPWQCREGQLFKLVYDMQNFVIGDWDGTGKLTFPVPEDIPRYLGNVYGAGWSEPPPPGTEWHWVWSMHNLMSVGRDMSKLSQTNLCKKFCSERDCFVSSMFLDRRPSCYLFYEDAIKTHISGVNFQPSCRGKRRDSANWFLEQLNRADLMDKQKDD